MALLSRCRYSIDSKRLDTNSPKGFRFWGREKRFDKYQPACDELDQSYPKSYAR